MEQIIALANEAALQIASWPVVTGKEKVKRFIKGGLLGQKLAPVDPFSWPNAMLGEGLLAAFAATGEKKYLLAVADHLKRWKTSGFRIYYVDNILNGTLAIALKEQLLTAQEDRFLKEEKEELLQLCSQAERACADWLLAAPKTAGGILPYRTHHADWFFADTAGIVCPFLCRCGAEEKDARLLELGVRQLSAFLEKGMDQRTGLPYHGYDGKTGMKYGIIGWGRACGWLMAGLTGSLPWIPKEHGEYEKLQAACAELAETVGKYQRPDGGFSWQLEATEGHRDNSAEGMIGAALVKMETDRDGNAAGTKTADLARLAAACKSSVEGGRVKDCSAECLDFAQYPQIYGCYPWGLGSVLEFLSLQER